MAGPHRHHFGHFRRLDWWCGELGGQGAGVRVGRVKCRRAAERFKAARLVLQRTKGSSATVKAGTRVKRRMLRLQSRMAGSGRQDVHRRSARRLLLGGRRHMLLQRLLLLRRSDSRHSHGHVLLLLLRLSLRRGHLLHGRLLARLLLLLLLLGQLRGMLLLLLVLLHVGGRRAVVCSSDCRVERRDLRVRLLLLQQRRLLAGSLLAGGRLLLVLCHLHGWRPEIVAARLRRVQLLLLAEAMQGSVILKRRTRLRHRVARVELLRLLGRQGLLLKMLLLLLQLLRGLQLLLLWGLLLLRLGRSRGE